MKINNFRRGAKYITSVSASPEPIRQRVHVPFAWRLDVSPVSNRDWSAPAITLTTKSGADSAERRRASGWVVKERKLMENKTIAKTTPTLADLAPAGVDGRVWIKVLKEQLLSSKNSDPTDAELLYFARVCQASGLDPARREIYGIYRNVKQRDGTYKPRLSIQTGIDGFRSTAEKSGKYGGSKEPEFMYDSELKVTVNHSGTDKTVPNTARVTVLKVMGDRVLETTRTANWPDYYPGDREGSMWRKLPETMLAKVAEAQALRAAFPNCGQLYLEEEMQAPAQDEVTESEAIREKIKNAQSLDELFEILNGLPMDMQKQVTQLIDTRSKELQNATA